MWIGTYVRSKTHVLMCGVFVQLSQSPSAALGSMSGHGKIGSTQKAGSLQGKGKGCGKSGGEAKVGFSGARHQNVTRATVTTVCVLYNNPKNATTYLCNVCFSHLVLANAFPNILRHQCLLLGLLGRVHRRVRGVLHSRARKRLVDHPSRPMGLDGLGYNGTR